VATELKKHFDSIYGGTWHAVVRFTQCFQVGGTEPRALAPNASVTSRLGAERQRFLEVGANFGSSITQYTKYLVFFQLDQADVLLFCSDSPNKYLTGNLGDSKAAGDNEQKTSEMGQPLQQGDGRRRAPTKQRANDAVVARRPGP
jgi:hypothetical protein